MKKNEKTNAAKKTNALDGRIVGNLTWRPIVEFFGAVAIFIAISLAFFYPNVLQGDVLRQNDVIQGLANGQEAGLFEQQTGEHSRWTDALFGGMPTFQISPAYKGTSWLGWAAEAYRLWLPSPMNLLFVLMLGFFIMLLAFKVKWWQAVLGAIAYGFSSYFIILIGAGHIWKLLVLIYIPPTLGGIVLCYRGKYITGGALTAFFAALQLMSNHVQMSYYSLIVVAAIAIAALCKALSDKKLGRWCVATCVLVVAAGLALAANSPNLLLTYKYSQETIRGGHSELTPQGTDAITTKPTTNGLDKDYITQWSYGKAETFTLLIPNVKGGATIKPVKGENKPLLLSETKKGEDMINSGEARGIDAAVLQQTPQYFGDQPMTNGPVYVGALICALFLLSCVVVKGPLKWTLLVATILSIMLAWGKNFMGLTDWFIDYFPMYNKFRTVSSILVVAEITMPLLAVLALKEMFSQENFFKNHKQALFWTFGITALFCLLGMLCPSIFGTGMNDQETQMFNGYVNAGQLSRGDLGGIDNTLQTVRNSMVSADSLRSLAIVVIGFVLLLLYCKKKLSATVAAVTLSALVLVDLFAINKRYLSEESFVEKVESAQVITPRPVDTQILQDTTHYRVLDLQHFSEAMPSYFHNTVGGYHAAKLTRYNDLIERQISKNNISVLNMLNTRYVIVNDNTVQQNPQALGNAWFVDSLRIVENADQEMAFLDHFNPATQAVADAKFGDVLGTAKPRSAGDTISLTSYAPNHLTYHSHSANGGLAVFSEIYFPWGWKINVDGQPAEMGRVNYVLRAMQLPAGDHEIDFRFDPDEVNRTETLASVAVIVIYLLLLGALNLAVFGKAKQKDA